MNMSILDAIKSFPQTRDCDLTCIRFNYPANMSKMDYTDICHFTDDHFRRPATEYNTRLATVSLCFALTSFMSSNWDGGYGYKYRNADAFLRTCDFIDVEANDAFKNRPTSESVGVLFGKKVITDVKGPHTLIAVGIRGGMYEAEFAGNLRVGSGIDIGGLHEGFYDGANKVLSELRGYISNMDITGNIKIWITGFSRSAIIANIVAGLLDESIVEGVSLLGDDVVLEKDDLFAYMMAAPAGVQYHDGDNRPDPSSETYNNIWSVVCRSDMVPMMAMEKYGFHRYGTDIFLPDPEDGERYHAASERMFGFYHSLPSREGPNQRMSDDFVPYKVSLDLDRMGIEVDTERPDATQKEVLREILEMTLDSFGGREGFVSEYQTDVVGFTEGMYSISSDSQVLLRLVKEIGAVLTSSPDAASELFMMLYIDDIDSFRNTLSDAITRGLETCELDTGKADDFADAITSVVFCLKEELLSERGLNDLVSLSKNMDCIISSHSTDLYYAWLKSVDPNYD